MLRAGIRVEATIRGHWLTTGWTFEVNFVDVMSGPYGAVGLRSVRVCMMIMMMIMMTMMVRFLTAL